MREGKSKEINLKKPNAKHLDDTNNILDLDPYPQEATLVPGTESRPLEELEKTKSRVQALEGSVTRFQGYTVIWGAAGLLVAALSLLVAFLSYQKMETIKTAYDQRSTLGVKPGPSVPSVRIESPKQGETLPAGSPITISAVATSGSTEIVNDGDLPLKEVKLIIRYPSSVTAPKLPEFEPLIEYPEVTSEAGVTTLRLKNPIAPRHTIQIRFPTIPDEAVLTTEHGDRITVNTRDAGGRITKVEFYADGQFIGTQPTPPSNKP